MSSRSKRPTPRKHVTYPRLNLSVATSPTSTSTSTTTYPRLQLSVATSIDPSRTTTSNGYAPISLQSSTHSTSPLTIHTYGTKPKLELICTTTSTTIDTTTPATTSTTNDTMSDIDIHTRLSHDPIILHEDEWPDVDAIVEAHMATLQTHQPDMSHPTTDVAHDITPDVDIPHDITPYDEMDEYPPLSYLYADDDDDGDAEYQRHLANFDELTQRTETCDTQASIITVPYIETKTNTNWIDEPTQVQDAVSSSVSSPIVYVSKLDRFHQMQQHDNENENENENENQHEKQHENFNDESVDDQYEDGMRNGDGDRDRDMEASTAQDDMDSELAPTPPLEEYDE